MLRGLWRPSLARLLADMPLARCALPLQASVPHDTREASRRPVRTHSLSQSLVAQQRHFACRGVLLFGCVCVPSVRTECFKRVATRVVPELRDRVFCALIRWVQLPNFAPPQRLSACTQRGSRARCATSFSCCCSRSAALRCCCRRRSRVPACRAAACSAPSPQRHPRRRLSSRYLVGEGEPAAGVRSVAGAGSVAGGAAAAVAVGEAAGAAEGSPPCGRLLTHTHAKASGALRSTSAPGGTRWASFRASLTSGEC